MLQQKKHKVIQLITIYYSNRVLERDEKTSLGIIKWDLALILIALWIIIFIALRKNIILSSNPSFCLGIIPPMVILLLFLKAIFLEGAKNGLEYFFQFSWRNILDANVS